MRSYPIREDLKAAQLSRLEVMRARHRGRVDGRRLTLSAPAPGRSVAAEEAWTPFIAQARDVARATSNQMIAWLLESNGDLVRKTYKQAETVIREHDVARNLTEGARGRFVESLSTWRVAAAAGRARAEAAVDHANLLIHCYWQAFLLGYSRVRRHHPGLPVADRWQPGTAVIDAIWANADALLLLSFGDQEEDEATTCAGRTLRRALEITAGAAPASHHPQEKRFNASYPPDGQPVPGPRRPD